MTRPELLSPAGDLERLQYAIRYGADAVYAALTEFGMRAAPDNFTPAQLEEGCIFAHARGKRVYLTLNTLPTNAELDRLPQAIADARAAGVDGFIVADLGVLRMVQKLAPDVEIHFSTQMGITNHAAATAAFELGAKRVVLARELSLEDIATIRAKTPRELELEVFVHGAMCMSVSGRCLLSQYLTETKIRYSVQLLTSRQLKIIDIAQLLGYENQSTFSSHFRAIYQCTPSQYLKEKFSE